MVGGGDAGAAATIDDGRRRIDFLIGDGSTAPLSQVGAVHRQGRVALGSQFLNKLNTTSLGPDNGARGARPWVRDIEHECMPHGKH